MVWYSLILDVLQKNNVQLDGMFLRLQLNK